MITFAPISIVVEQVVLGALLTDTNDILMRQVGGVLQLSHFVRARELHLLAHERRVLNVAEASERYLFLCWAVVA